MSWWGYALGRLGFGPGRLANLDRGQQVSGSYSRYTDAEITVTDERAVGLSAVWGCVRLIVQSGATLPIKCYTLDGEKERVWLPDDDPMCRMLNGRPNPWMNGQEFRQAMWTQRLLWGNAYAAIRRDGAGKIAALIPKKAEHVVVNREDWGIKYEYTTESGTEVYENRINQPPQMLHWKGWGPDGVIGLSTLSYARHTMGITLSADRKAATSFSGRPNGVLATDTFLTPEQRDDLRGLYEGVGNSTVGDGQMWLLEGGFKYEPIGLPPDDLQMLQTRAFQLAEICRFFGVPQVMLDGGEKGASWPASYEKQVLAFKTFTLGPFFEEFEQKVAEVFGDGRYAEHDSSGLVRPDSQTMAAYLATLVSNGLMTRNEARRQLKLPAMDQEGADDLTVQLNMAGLDDLHEGDGNAEQAPQPNQ